MASLQDHSWPFQFCWRAACCASWEEYRPDLSAATAVENDEALLANIDGSRCDSHFICRLLSEEVSPVLHLLHPQFFLRTKASNSTACGLLRACGGARGVIFETLHLKSVTELLQLSPCRRKELGVMALQSWTENVPGDRFDADHVQSERFFSSGCQNSP